MERGGRQVHWVERRRERGQTGWGYPTRRLLGYYSRGPGPSGTFLKDSRVRHGGSPVTVVTSRVARRGSTDLRVRFCTSGPARTHPPCPGSKTVPGRRPTTTRTRAVSPPPPSVCYLGCRVGGPEPGNSTRPSATGFVGGGNQGVHRVQDGRPTGNSGPCTVSRCTGVRCHPSPDTRVLLTLVTLQSEGQRDVG